jgi:hypothetical protein
MTHPLGEPLAISLKTELLFYARCLAHILGGYGVTVLAAILSSQRQTGGMFGLTVAILILWLAGATANMLVWTFDEPILQMLATTALVMVPFGILCGPVVRAMDPNSLLAVLGGLALLLVAAGLVGIALPTGAYHSVPWWSGAGLMTLVIHLIYLADSGLPVLGSYLCALMLAVCTAADTNRAVSDLYVKPYHASRLGAMLWLDATNVVRQLQTRVIKN